MADLLLEVGTEELPPGDIGPATAQLGERVRAALEALRLDAGPLTTYGAPRRLAVLVRGVAERQRPVERSIRGPAAAAAFDAQGRPTPAAVGFARSQGVPVERLEIAEEAGGRRYVVATVVDRGKTAAAVLPAALTEAIAALSFAKTMRWGAGEVRFARPIRWLVALLGRRVLRLTVAGVRAGRASQGHRSLAPGPRIVPDPAGYVERLRAARVIVDPGARRRTIEAQAGRLAREVGGRAVLDPRLLDEIVMSVEHPRALRGAFDAGFLSLPREVLVTVMQHHQKYFAIEDGQGRLHPAFIAVRDGGTAHLATVRENHEWVLAARLTDARFFFTEDRKTHLEDGLPALDRLLFHPALGTMGERIRRLVGLARALAVLLLLDGRTTEALVRAATLCKADLVTHLVGEFPELQGTIGQIYAAMDGEATDVARAIGEHYRPVGAGDSAPKTHLGALLGLVDKLDTVTGAIGAGLMPTGSQDPFGLRRAAQGIVEIVHMLRLRTSALALVAAAQDQYGRRDEAAAREVVEFLRQRLRATLLERGVRYDLADAALAVSGDDLLAAGARAESLAASLGHPGFAALYVAYDRASRILTAEAEGPVDPVLFEAAVEGRLYDAVRAVGGPVAEAAEAGDFQAALRHLQPLVPPVNQIFDDVLIMAPDGRVRANRLALLREVAEVFRQVADFSRIVMGEGEKNSL